MGSTIPILISIKNGSYVQAVTSCINSEAYLPHVYLFPLSSLLHLYFQGIGRDRAGLPRPSRPSLNLFSYFFICCLLLSGSYPLACSAPAARHPPAKPPDSELSPSQNLFSPSISQALVSYTRRSLGISAGTIAHPSIAACRHDPLDGPSERFPSVGILSNILLYNISSSLPTRSLIYCRYPLCPSIP